MEAPVFALFCLAVGYLMYWTVTNEKRDPNSGSEGWFATKPAHPKDEVTNNTRDGQSRDTRSGA